MSRFSFQNSTWKGVFATSQCLVWITYSPPTTKEITSNSVAKATEAARDFGCDYTFILMLVSGRTDAIVPSQLGVFPFPWLFLNVGNCSKTFFVGDDANERG